MDDEPEHEWLSSCRCGTTALQLRYCRMSDVTEQLRRRARNCRELREGDQQIRTRLAELANELEQEADSMDARDTAERAEQLNRLE